MANNGTAESVFANYAQLSKEDRLRFQAMMAGYSFREQSAVAAGQKAGQTRRKRKAAAVAPTTTAASD